MEIVLRTATPDGVEVVLPALVYAKVLEEHTAVADLAIIDPRSGSRTPAGRTLVETANVSFAASAA